MMRQRYDSVTLPPFCCSSPSINDMLKIMLLMMIPHIIMLIITSSINSLILLGVTTFAAIGAELTYGCIKKIGLKLSWSSLLQGLIIGMFLPSGYPIFIACIVPFTILFFQKLIYFDFAQSWINPMAIAIIIMFFISPDFFPDFLLSVEDFQYINAGSRLFTEGIIQTASFDQAITDMLNSRILTNFDTSIPVGYVTLFWDTQSLIPAFRFNLFTLLASVILVSFKAVDYIIPFVYVCMYAMLVYIFSLYPYGGIFGSGDILLALLTSGTLFSAFFLLGWFGTIPVTIIGKLAYGVCAGLFSFLICGAGTSSIGNIFTVLMMNIVSPIIQYFEDFFKIAKLRNLLSNADIDPR